VFDRLLIGLNSKPMPRSIWPIRANGNNPTLHHSGTWEDDRGDPGEAQGKEGLAEVYSASMVLKRIRVPFRSENSLQVIST